MRLCPLCATAVPPNNEFCGKCSTPVDGAPSATETVHQPRSSASSSSKSMDEGRFTPRKIARATLAGSESVGPRRHGRDYRANDLLLGRTVASSSFPPNGLPRRPPSHGSAMRCASRGRSRILMSTGCTTSAKPKARLVFRWNTSTARTCPPATAHRNVAARQSAGNRRPAMRRTGSRARQVRGAPRFEAVQHHARWARPVAPHRLRSARKPVGRNALPGFSGGGGRARYCG